MDIDLLKKVKIRQLDPIIQSEAIGIAKEFGIEESIKSNSTLHFLYQNCCKQEAKEKKSRERLQKAKNIILSLVALSEAVTHRETKRRKQEQERKRSFRLVTEELKASKKTIELLKSIGIYDEKIAGQAEAMFGVDSIELRVEFIEYLDLDTETKKKLFGSWPNVLLIPDEEEFISELESIGTKKKMITIWSQTSEKPIPIWADFRIFPGILLDEYHDIARLLDLEEQEQVEESEKKEVTYKGKPMYPNDFAKVVEALGFEKMRESNHGTLFRRGDNIMCVQRSHKAQTQLNKSVVKAKLVESGVDLNEFEEKRRELRL
ncbi:MAG: hypothetical protein ABH983_03255 [Candidatus Micrarchaeota archaeon]